MRRCNLAYRIPHIASIMALRTEAAEVNLMAAGEQPSGPVTLPARVLLAPSQQQAGRYPGDVFRLNPLRGHQRSVATFLPCQLLFPVAAGPTLRVIDSPRRCCCDGAATFPAVLGFRLPLHACPSLHGRLWSIVCSLSLDRFPSAPLGRATVLGLPAKAQGLDCRRSKSPIACAPVNTPCRLPWRDFRSCGQRAGH